MESLPIFLQRPRYPKHPLLYFQPSSSRISLGGDAAPPMINSSNPQKFNDQGQLYMQEISLRIRRKRKYQARIFHIRPDIPWIQSKAGSWVLLQQRHGIRLLHPFKVSAPQHDLVPKRDPMRTEGRGGVGHPRLVHIHPQATCLRPLRHLWSSNRITPTLTFLLETDR